ncbi:MAG TPA: glycosyltransferase family 4 protein [Thermoanaerobaculia bacterium]|nr:glycosyltransferase family 4 protein [Thermoanaerobaculia bacterium]
MRIAYISAGAAHMYCGSCLHDNTLVAALQRLGHDAVLVPTYTRLRTDEPDVSIDRVFFGALNVYLKQIAPLLRRAPARLERLLDRPRLLALVSRLGSSTDPRRLGELTLSILRGEEGHQAGELDKLLGWLRDTFQPEVVHLTNSMFAGFARRLKAELGVPVLCSVQGEELFLDSLPEPSRGEVRAALAERARDIDLFVAPNRFYADFMASYLGVERTRLAVVPLGIQLSGHGSAGSTGSSDSSGADLAGYRPPPAAAPEAGRPWVIGYLARIAPEKGLQLLADAFRQVALSLGAGRVRLHVAGYLPAQHRGYLRGIERQLAGWGLAGAYRYFGEVTREEKLRFLAGLDVLAAPALFAEPKGLYVLEALASGVPVVAPRRGAFPELLEETGGGVLVAPDAPAELAAALGELLADPERRERLGRAGRAAVHGRFSAEAMAAATLALYERCLDGAGGERTARAAGAATAAVGGGRG